MSARTAKRRRPPASAKKETPLPPAPVGYPHYGCYSDIRVPYREWHLLDDGSRGPRWDPLGMVGRDQSFREDVYGSNGASRFFIRRHRGSGGLEALDSKSAHQALGHAMPRWDFVVALNYDLRRRSNPNLQIGQPPDALERGFFTGPEAFEVWGLPYRFFHEQRAAFWASVRALAADVPPGIRLYAVDTAARENSTSGGGGVLPAPHGALLVFAEGPGAALPELHGAVAPVERDGLREWRYCLWDSDVDAVSLWRYLAARVTPLTHEFRYGQVDPLTAFLGEYKRWTRQPRLWIVKPESSGDA